MKHKSIVENVAKIIFTVCAVVAIFAVLSITIYMFLKGAPAFFKVGVLNLLFGTKWAPTAADPSYGILYIILTSIIGTAVSILIGVPIALLTAVFLTEVSNKKLSAVVQPAVELLAAIPSVIYGLLGLMILNPVLYKLEKHIFANSATHQFTGGSNLLAAIIVLAIMILPTVINMSVSSIQAVPQQMRAASLALGATKIQTIFKVTVPAAKSGIMTGIVLGIVVQRFLKSSERRQRFRIFLCRIYLTQPPVQPLVADIMAFAFADDRFQWLGKNPVRH